VRFLTLIEVLALHHRVIEQSGGAFGIRDLGLLESAIASGELGREALVEWLRGNTIAR